MKNKISSIHVVITPSLKGRASVLHFRVYVLRGYVSTRYEISAHNPALNWLGRLEDRKIVHTASELSSDVIDLFYRSSEEA